MRFAHLMLVWIVALAVAEASAAPALWITQRDGNANGDLLTWNGTSWIAQQPATRDNMQPFLGVNYIIYSMTH